MNKDDIYLTSTLKPVGFKSKFNNVFLKPFLIIVLIVGLLGALVYFVLVPVYLKYFFRNPERVFSDVFDSLESDVIDFLIDNNKGYYSYDIDLDIDSNLDILIPFNDKKYSFKFSSDTKEGNLLLLSDNNGVSFRKRNNGSYLGIIGDEEKLYTYDEHNALEDVYDFFDLDIAKFVGDIFDNLRSLNTKDRLSYTDEVIVINGEELKAVRNSLKLNKDDVNKVFNLNLDEDIEVVINAYTTGITFRGLDIEINGFRRFYYYESDTKEEIYFNIESNGKSNIVKLLGVKKDDIVECVVNYNNSEIGTLNISKGDNKSINIDFNLYILTIDFVGNISYESVNNKETLIVDAKVKDKYLKIKVNTDLKYDGFDINSIDSDKVLKYDKDSYMKDINGILEKENLLDVYNKLFNNKVEETEDSN